MVILGQSVIIFQTLISRLLLNGQAATGLTPAWWDFGNASQESIHKREERCSTYRHHMLHVYDNVNVLKLKDYFNFG